MVEESEQSVSVIDSVSSIISGSIASVASVISSGQDTTHSSASAHGDSHGHHATSDDPLFRDHHAMLLNANLITYVVTAILVGLALREVNKKTSFPYSPMVLSVGILLGLMQNAMGAVGVSTAVLNLMHPHLILFAFIPILLFESAFNCDWFVFRRVLANILILAGPGVAWGAILIGLIFKLILQYPDDQISWYQAFTLGSVLSATDPVAVVALLKELGASPQFNILVEGEALFNDGSAMVFFVFFANLSKGGSTGVIPVIQTFVRNSLIGPCIGLVYGFLASLWTRRVMGDEIEVVWLMFVFTWITFYTCEFTFFKTSGILGTICLGLFWSALGKVNIRPEIEHAVHTVWGFVQYATDTLIFLLCGIIIGTVVITEVQVYPDDWAKIIVFYFLMILARGVMIMTCYPFLRVFGYPISKAELIVMTYGGLRGALGICLALMVGVDDGLPARFRHLTVFYMLAMTAMTNLINGTTCKALVMYLKMIEESPIRKKIYKLYLKDCILHSNETQKHLSNDPFFTMVDWGLVKQLTGTEDLKKNIHELDDNLEQRGTYDAISEGDMFGEVRYRILRILKGLYFSKFEEGVSEGDACRLLVESSNISLDNLQSQLNIWELLSNGFTSLGFIQYFFRAVVIGRFAKSYITRNLRFIYDVTTTFITCGREALHLLEGLPVSKGAIKAISDELNAEINKAIKHHKDLHSNFPEVIRAIQTRRAAYSVLMHMKEHLEKTHSDGLVDDLEFKKLYADVKQRQVALDNMEFDWQQPNLENFVQESPIFMMLYKEEVQQIMSNQFTKKLMQGEFLYEQGMTCSHFYILNKGSVKEIFTSEQSDQRDIGSILSYANALSPNGKCLSTCQVLEESTFQAMRMDVIQKVMSLNQEFEEKVCTNAMDYLTKIFPLKAGPLGKYEQMKLIEFFNKNAKFIRLDQHSKINFPNGGYIFRGEVVGNGPESKYSEFMYIPPGQGELRVTRNLLASLLSMNIEELDKIQSEKHNLMERESLVDKRFKEQHQKDEHREISRSGSKKVQVEPLEIETFELTQTH